MTPREELESLRRLKELTARDHQSRLDSAQTTLGEEQAKSAPTSVLHKAGTGLDLAMAALTSIPAAGMSGAAGVGSAILKNAGINNDPTALKNFVGDLRYHTTPGYGQDVADALTAGAGNTLAPLAGGVSGLDRAIGRYAGPRVQQNVRDAAGFLGDAGAMSSAIAAPAAVSKLATLLPKNAEKYLATTAPNILRAAGYNISPRSITNMTGAGEVPGRGVRTLQAVGGANELNASNIASNRGITHDILLQDVGLPAQTKIPNNPHGMKELLARAAKEPIGVYRGVEAALPEADAMSLESSHPAISQLGRGTSSQAEIPASVQSLKNHWQGVTDMSGSNALANMTDLRQAGYKNLTSTDVNAVALGKAQLSISKMIEGHLTDALHAVNPEMSAEFGKARTTFAKLHAMEAARDANNIDPQALRMIGDEAGTFTGGAKLVQDAAAHAPADIQLNIPNVSNERLVGGSTAAGLGSLMGSVIGGPAGAVVGAASGVAARAGARRLVRALGGAEVTPQLSRQGPLRNYFNRPGTDPSEFSLTSGPGRVSQPPAQPPLHGLGDMNVPLAESTQNPRTSLSLAMQEGDPGRWNLSAPRQGNLDVFQGDTPTPTAFGPTGRQESLFTRADVPADYLPPVKNTVTEAQKRIELDALMWKLSKLRGNRQ